MAAEPKPAFPFHPASPVTHPTKELDADVVRLLAMIQTGMDDMRKEQNAMRSDLCGHLHQMQDDMKGMREEVQAVKRSGLSTIAEVGKLAAGQRKTDETLEGMKDELGGLRHRVKHTFERHAEHAQRTSETDLEHDAAISGAALHMGKIDTELSGMRKTLDEVVQVVRTETGKTNQALGATNQALGAVVNEMGVQDKVQLGDSVPPGQKSKSSTMKTLKNRQAITIASTIAASVLILLQILQQTLNQQRASAAPVPTPPVTVQAP